MQLLFRSGSHACGRHFLRLLEPKVTVISKEKKLTARNNVNLKTKRDVLANRIFIVRNCEFGYL